MTTYILIRTIEKILTTLKMHNMRNKPRKFRRTDTIGFKSTFILIDDNHTQTKFFHYSSFVFVDHGHFPSDAKGLGGYFDAGGCLAAFVFAVSESFVGVVYCLFGVAHFD